MSTGIWEFLEREWDASENSPGLYQLLPCFLRRESGEVIARVQLTILLFYLNHYKFIISHSWGNRGFFVRHFWQPVQWRNEGQGSEIVLTLPPAPSGKASYSF